MRHDTPDETLTKIERRLQDQAAVLADRMNDWLTREGPSPLYPGVPQITPPAEMSGWASAALVEWCRQARDILEEVARG